MNNVAQTSIPRRYTLNPFMHPFCLITLGICIAFLFTPFGRYLRSIWMIEEYLYMLVQSDNPILDQVLLDDIIKLAANFWKLGLVCGPMLTILVYQYFQIFLSFLQYLKLWNQPVPQDQNECLTSETMK